MLPRSSLLPALVTALLVGHPPVAAQEPASGPAAEPWAPGEVRFIVPELPAVGQTFEVIVAGETGDRLLAALHINAAWNPDAVSFVEVQGGLTAGASSPFAFNDRIPGEITISDINAPQKTGSGGAVYNPEMRGRVELYRIVLRRKTEAALELRGRLEAFHDPGDATVNRGASPIGDDVLPRPVLVDQAGAAAAAAATPTGHVWLRLPAAVTDPGQSYSVPIGAQLAREPLERFCLTLRYDPRRQTVLQVRAEGKGALVSDSAVPGQLWISGGGDAVGERDDSGQAYLCRIELRSRGEPEVAPELRGMVVSFHGVPGAEGRPRPLGDLPLPRPIEVRR